MIDGLLIGWAIQQSMQRGQQAAGSGVAAEVKSKADALQIELDRFSLVTEALWLLLKEKLGCTDEELVATIEQIDARDGRRDGRAGKQEPKICPQCGRTLMKQIPKCVYCGQEIQWEPFHK